VEGRCVFVTYQWGKPQVSVSRCEQGYGCLFFEAEEALAVMPAKDAY